MPVEVAAALADMSFMPSPASAASVPYSTPPGAEPTMEPMN